MIDLDLEKGPTDLKYFIHEFKKAEAFVKVDGRKRRNSSLSIVYGTENTRTIQRDFFLSKPQDKEASKLSDQLLEWDANGVSAEVVVGALMKYLERKNNEPS